VSEPSLAALRGAVDLSGLVRQPARPASAAAPATPAPGPEGAAGAPGVVVEADDRVFPSLIELSQRVPVVVEFVARGLEPALASIVEGYGGRLVLAVVDADANPQLAQAFQVQQIPAVAAVIGGRPLQLFTGLPSDDEIRQVLDQVLELAAQNGVTGSVPTGAAGDDADAAAEPAEEPLPPLHQEAFDAISRGDYAGAATAYRTAIAQDPRDALAVAGLAQASLLERLDGVEARSARDAAAAAPADASAQFVAADLDLAGGHVDDAFGRLLDLFPSLAGADRDAARTRLLEYFEIVGADDPRTGAARRRLTSLLY
jgi:putative thioredoxin